ncbi:hypothetical protein QZH41_019539 [Actinostola sp. cb2023]|nr:hypothetical protein QZH41_019539 [Actinostola sp. cb2023]
MQHSPQEIKSRLDKAVDPEGNVLDMAAVLELVSTLERLPLTREALETTRIGKTINLLRKKTNNDDLARRAKKLVKKWQKLVINQLEASRSVDSPLNGSRISSPQINGAFRDNKSIIPSVIDRTVKARVNDGGKKGLKRKHSTSSLSNSPLTLSQDTMSPCTPSDNSSDPSSPFTTTEISQPKETLLLSESKRPKLTVDLNDKNGSMLSVQTEGLQRPDCGGKNTVNKPINSNNQDVNININAETTRDMCGRTSGETNSPKNNLSQSLDSFYNDSGIDSLGSNVNTSAYSQQLTPDQETDNKNSCTILDSQKSTVQEEIAIECKDNRTDVQPANLLVKNGTSLLNNETVGELSDSTALETRITSVENSLSPNLESSRSIKSEADSSIGIDVTESKDLERLEGTSEITEVMKNDEESMTMEEEESSEPKVLILDLSQEASGINGRFNDQGKWYPWLDVMPYNDGNLNILPYVILD